MPDRTTSGADVVSVLVFNGRPHVWYHDDTNGALRHGWYG